MEKYLVIGDIHARGDLFKPYYERAVKENLPILFLGDSIDRGDTPDLLFDMIGDLRERNLIKAFVVGNHEHKVYRHYLGREVNTGLAQIATIDFFDNNPGYLKLFMELVADSYLMYSQGNNYFVHAAMNPNLIGQPNIMYHDFITGKIPKRGLDIFLYGYTTGRTTEDGFPERKMDWIDRIPANTTVYKGHDYMYDVVTTRVGALGGKVVFVDTGSGHKGGVLSGVEIA